MYACLDSIAGTLALLAAQPCWESYMEYVGDNVSPLSESPKTMAECQRLCQQTPGCAFSTFSTVQFDGNDQSYCLLRSSAAVRKPNTKHATNASCTQCTAKGSCCAVCTKDECGTASATGCSWNPYVAVADTNDASGKDGQCLTGNSTSAPKFCPSASTWSVLLNAHRLSVPACIGVRSRMCVCPIVS